MEEFFRAVAKYDGTPHIHAAMFLQELHQFFEHGMDVSGPPDRWELARGQKRGFMGH